jgi:hypothetical protein
VNIAGHQVISATAPSAAPVAVGWEWADTANALLKLCTSISPYTFVTMGGGVPAAHAASHASGGGDPVTLAESQVTNLATDLAAKAVATRNIISGGGLTGGGDLSADRTIAVGAGTGITVNADDVAVNYGTSGTTACAGNDSRLAKTTTYVPTLVSAVDNTQTALISFTVPANDMADGDILNITFASLLKNNKGTVGTAELLVDWGGVTVPLTDGAGGYAWSNNATERKWLYRIALMRVGADLWAYAPVTSTALSIDFLGATNPTVAYSGAQVCTPNFASSATVAVKITLSATDATFYFKPQQAYVVRGH